MIAKNIRKICKDDVSKIENYEQAINDKENMWICHHRLELTLDGEDACSRKDLIRMGMYYKRPYFELIFLTKKEHKKLHNGTNYMRYQAGKANRGKRFTEEHKTKLSKSVSESKTWVPRTEFGFAFLKHYGFQRKGHEQLYYKELHYYRKHKKYSWE